MTREEAIRISDSKWWEQNCVNPHMIVGFQLFEERLCMPFNVFHEAMEKVFMQSIFTHQFANQDFLNNLKTEFEKNYSSTALTKSVMMLVNSINN